MCMSLEVSSCAARQLCGNCAISEDTDRGCASGSPVEYRQLATTSEFPKSAADANDGDDQARLHPTPVPSSEQIDRASVRQSSLRCEGGRSTRVALGDCTSIPLRNREARGEIGRMLEGEMHSCQPLVCMYLHWCAVPVIPSCYAVNGRRLIGLAFLGSLHSRLWSVSVRRDFECTQALHVLHSGPIKPSSLSSPDVHPSVPKINV
ncbi:hypothetical protein OH76DRAFT_404324 [Lentinus brumalis]|uniref:Uncharacterized protein n=1 Tax=Lentinus brumalis TaxID=2498619 RepID=A0A371DVR4_9APHY|nr:hypothetical protein OH76DRAFT_404324 [Polyporus brumalis]